MNKSNKLIQKKLRASRKYYQEHKAYWKAYYIDHKTKKKEEFNSD
jgi:hypothetical protein